MQGRASQGGGGGERRPVDDIAGGGERRPGEQKEKDKERGEEQRRDGEAADDPHCGGTQSETPDEPPPRCTPVPHAFLLPSQGIDIHIYVHLDLLINWFKARIFSSFLAQFLDEPSFT